MNRDYIDLSYDIETGMPVYPGDIDVELKRDKNFQDDYYTSYILKTTMHSGTHIDGPMHLTDSNKFINDFDIYKFIGKATILDVRGEKEIDLKEEYKIRIKKSDIVILYTGYEEMYGTAKYYEEHPVITKELAEYIAYNNVNIVGFDMPSPDREPYEIHKILLENDVLILENLRNLNKLNVNKNYEIIAMPLKIKAEASLVRAIAREI